MTDASRVLALGLSFIIGGAGCSLLKKKESGDAGAGVANAGASATVPSPTTPTAANAPAANAADAGAAPTNATNTAPAKSALAVGSKGEVLWKGRWYAASILKAVGPDAYKIHYTGYESSWDEVVGSARMRGFGGASAATPSAAGARPAAAATGARPVAAAADAPCPGPGLTRRCSGHCVNIQTDDRNCGSCGTACPAGKHCDGHMFCRDAAGNL